MIFVILLFLFPCLLVICWNSFSTVHFILTVLLSVDFHNISCIPVKSVMRIGFCCFSSLILWGVWFFLWTFYVIFHIFSPLSKFDFICYAILMILLLRFPYILSVICSFMSFILSFITVFSYIFSVFWYCALKFFSVFLIAWYGFLDFTWNVSLLPLCYFVLPLTIYHSLLELSLPLISHLSASVSICSYIFCIHIW